ncbi:Membrane protein related to metalloendopeptidase [Candidatus Terasakiella magnetica]|nr:Membrane protein related to metalloendopeptidase [Candidatus Terasakiella magnetica]
MTDERSIPASSKRAKAWRRAVSWVIPEWQVFIRRPDGTAQHFIFTRKRQVMLLAVLAVITIWAGVVSTLLGRQPEELAVKERHLDEMMATTRASQQRLAASQKMVADIAREVDMVHSNIQLLAESSASLAKDHAPAKTAAVIRSRGRAGVEQGVGDDGPAMTDEARMVREQVRRLETSLDRLKTAYGQALQNTNAVAASRITDAERSLSRLGLDTERLIDRFRPDGGKGGPFVPFTSVTADSGLSNLLDRLDRWSGIKTAMQKMPLGEPLHQEYELNSGFGTRNDPLNRRTGMHEGIDLGAPFGSPVYATGEGVVEFAGPWDRYGLTIDINHGNGVSTRYAHLSRIKIKEGQRVTRNTVIGLLGNSGRSTGAHLHYEVRLSDTPRDPIKFIAAGTNAPKIW